MKKIIFSIFLFFIGFQWCKADSPITSTDFYMAYLDIQMVNYAKDNQLIDEQIANYLLNEKSELDIKMAIINALSWDKNARQNLIIFKNYLKLKYHSDSDVKQSKLNGDELLCLGYLTIMDNYFKPDEAIVICEKAVKKLQNNYTAQLILALCKAQKAMDSNWCDVYKIVVAVVQNPKLEQDMRKQANDIIMNYINLYQSSCNP